MDFIHDHHHIFIHDLNDIYKSRGFMNPSHALELDNYTRILALSEYVDISRSTVGPDKTYWPRFDGGHPCQLTGVTLVKMGAVRFVCPDCLVTSRIDL